MSKKDHNKAKAYEELTAEIHKKLTPDAIVKTNQKIFGAFSLTKRQLDVIIETPSESTIIECKNYKRPLHVKNVESILSHMDDVKAQKGMIISANGFSVSALRRLSSHPHIKPFKLIDTGGHDWKSTVSLPSACIVKNLVQFSFVIDYKNPIFPIPINDSFMLYDDNGTKIGESYDLLLKWWVTENHDILTGHQSIYFASGETNFLVGEKLIPVEITANIEVEKIIYFRNWPLAEISGFQNQINHEIETRGFTTASLSIDELKNNWTKINDIEGLSKQSTIKLHIVTWGSSL